MTVVKLSDATRAALERTAIFLKAQAQYLEQTGSQITLPNVVDYIQTLERLSQTNDATVTGVERDHVQQATFLLEGARNSYRNAEFDERAAKVEKDIGRLYDIVKAYNAVADD
jgi:cell division protein FtsB